MSISRWKIMACTLGLSVIGLATVAGQMNNRLNAQNGGEQGDRRANVMQAPHLTMFNGQSANTEIPAKPAPEVTLPAPVEPLAGKPASVVVVPETLAPTSQALEIEIVAPLAVPPVPAPPVVALEPIMEPNVRLYGSPEMLPMPRQSAVELELTTGDVLAVPMPVPAAPRQPMTTFPYPLENVQPAPARPSTPVAPIMPPVQQPVTPQVVPAPSVVPPVVPQPVIYRQLPAYPGQPPVCPSEQLVAPAPLPAAYAPPSQPPATPVQQASATTSSKLKMLLRLGDGKPRFEIRASDSTEVLFKVYAEKIEMQSAPEGMKSHPIAGVTAVGRVRFVGPGVEGTCDQLSVLSGTGEVLLKGNVCMKSKHGKTWSEMTAEKMIYQIGADGLTTSANSGAVRPASYSTRN